ncbi:Abc transporter b family member [Thalictrum thalictroides]|uniref:Abc transporter b family member n=1 Tax=Thalictrum thalictroides TaxID=46969 RepID=A0A7J6VKY5_THATH|nr:Abc transporter b family member [Thalictrum thalictroides]
MAEENTLVGDLYNPRATATEEDQPDSKPTKSVAFYKLFAFADSKDVLLMLIGTIASAGNGASMPIMTLFLGDMINAFGQNANTVNTLKVVSEVALKFVYLAIGAGIASCLQVACWMVTGERQAARMRSLYLKTILRQDIGFFDTETNTGEVIGRMSGDTVLIQDAMGEKVGKFLQLFATFVGGFVIAFTKGWLLALVMLSCIPPLVISGGVMALVVSKMASRGQAAYSDAGVVVEQAIGSIRTVASFTGEKHAIAKYEKSLAKAYKSGVHEGLATGLGLGAVMLIIFSTYSLAIWFGGKMILEKGYTGGDVLNIIVAVLTGSMSLGQASPCLAAFSAGQAAAYKMFETINRKPSIDSFDTRGQILDDIRGEIELKNVCFSYPARPDEQIFNGFSLTIPSGTTAALVGQSGSGKSTVISLIERFYDPLSGEVLIDGINLKEFQLRWIRQKIGLVSQEPVLFASSIKENIAYAKDGATTEEIRAAAELANAAKFIDKLPRGLDTLVGEHGTQLSGGQKQRIAIARAILKNPRILLLDEATSALDAESEHIVQEALDRIMVNRTTVIVAHRLTTVRNADMIAVIHQGKIVEKGSHSKLLKIPDGAYTQLIRLQELNKSEDRAETAGFSRNASQRQSFGRSISRGSSGREFGRNPSQHQSFARSLSRGSSVGNSSRHSFSVAFGLPSGIQGNAVDSEYPASSGVTPKGLARTQRRFDDGKTSFGKVFRVFFALTMAAIGISQSSSLAPDSSKAKSSTASIYGILDRKSLIDSSEESGTTLDNVKGEIELRHVSFKYATRPDVQIFRDLSLVIHSGKTVALVGESGSGKSTVISLLQRFYNPDSGRITLDGVEIQKFQLRWLRLQMGLVSQEPALFNDTIRANIAYGKEGVATEAEIIAAAELANAHKFICSLQQGYDTVVGERGIQLSGGQKQRVAIARAIVKAPKILLLDEATSALDAESERVVQDALDRVIVNRTTVVVAHRLSTIQNADLIAVVKNGVIAEKGKHDSLIKIHDGVYASLVALHMSAT